MAKFAVVLNNGRKFEIVADELTNRGGGSIELALVTTEENPLQRDQFGNNRFHQKYTPVAYFSGVESVLRIDTE